MKYLRFFLRLIIRLVLALWHIVLIPLRIIAIGSRYMQIDEDHYRRPESRVDE